MSIYQHFRPEEKEFIDQVLNWRDSVEQTYAPRLTDFLDPRQQYIVNSIIGKNHDWKVSFFGGIEMAERKRAIIYPNYFTPIEDDYEITLFEIMYPEKFVTLTHPEVLGSLMGLGLKRSKFGDIFIREKSIQFLTASEIAEYIRANFVMVGRTKIQLVERPFTEILNFAESISELNFTVSSLRIDTVLANASRLSRQKIQSLIEQGLVKVNWAVVHSTSYELQEGDVISARGIGRIRLLTIGDKTKKDKWKITVGKYK
ncbi:YlmH family RNA-binding protein [Bacillus andreraoultii]|uniref:YlmH family RNA-binding protein n=1 Tax=Bacillus andreraoultii TaxID=1499685 RepID=UPI00053AF088|nr:RNA-binding protein [Bacillus andreraoultii]